MARPIQYQKNIPDHFKPSLTKLVLDVDNLRRESTQIMGRGSLVTKRIGVIHTKLEELSHMVHLEQLEQQWTR